MSRSRVALSRMVAATTILIVIIVVIGAVAIAADAITTDHPTPSVSTTTVVSNNSSAGSNFVLNQPPVTRYFTVTWEKSPQAEQDRFTPFNIIVAQGDTVHITFIVNDSAAHTFTIGAPYNFQINDSVPGLTNDLTGQNFTTAPTNNSPGVTVTGAAGNVTGTGSFIVKYTGVFEFYCIY
ncbi:MAG: hypothetical protein ACREBS_10450, partial [Nitrososphaerales archaeon]